MISGQKPTLEGEGIRNVEIVKGIPYAEEIQLGRHLINLWRP
jgi:hypothetical protein